MLIVNYSIIAIIIIYLIFRAYYKPPADPYPVSLVHTCQANLEEIVGEKTSDGVEVECMATVIPELTIAAVKIRGILVGQIGVEAYRKFQKKYPKNAAKKEPIICHAMIVGGWRRKIEESGETLIDEGNFGVKLALDIY